MIYQKQRNREIGSTLKSLQKWQIMFLPKHFQQQNPEELKALIRAFPFATLITQDNETGIAANHLPLYLTEDPDGTTLLQGHIARPNPLWKNNPAPEKTQDALVIFQGEHGYITPNWYPGKQTHHKVVPTWNYAVVHARGELRFIEDHDWLLGLLENLTDQHEANQPEPWKVSDAPAEYIDKMMKAIVGFEIRVDSLTGKWKLSQNHPQENQQGVIAGLDQSVEPGTSALAERMKS